jgi:hypothetical protein
LLKGQLDITANGDVLALLGPFIGGLHHSWATARNNAKASPCKQARRFRGRLIDGIIGAGARRAENGYRGRDMRQGIEAIDKLACNAHHAPGIGNGEIKIECAFSGMLFLAHMFAGNWLSGFDQWLRGALEESLILCLGSPLLPT